MSMSLCSFHAGRCHGDPLFFISEGVCDPDVSTKLEWAKFRAQMSSKSSVQKRCGLDTCYQWESCSGEEPAWSLENICLWPDVLSKQILAAPHPREVELLKLPAHLLVESVCSWLA